MLIFPVADKKYNDGGRKGAVNSLKWVFKDKKTIITVKVVI